MKINHINSLSGIESSYQTSKRPNQNTNITNPQKSDFENSLKIANKAAVSFGISFILRSKSNENNVAENKFNKYNSAKKTKNGNIIVEKNLVSQSGTKTKYLYVEKPNGDRSLYSKITDKNGEIISMNSQKFKVLDENHFQSIENGETFDINYLKDKVVVTRDNGDTVEISIGDNYSDKGVISCDLLPLTKQLPGSVYFDMSKGRLRKIAVDDYEEPNNATYYGGRREIMVAKELSSPDMLFDLLHELGHFRDRTQLPNLHANKEFLKTFKEERKEFYQTATRDDIKTLKHLISDKGNLEEDAAEIFAECHALMYVPTQNRTRAHRVELVQKYFPETVAAATKLTNKEIEKNKNLWEDHISNLENEIEWDFE